MENNYEIVDLFPSPLFKTNVPNSLSKVLPFLNSQLLRKEEFDSLYGQKSKDTYILNNPECKDLSNFILNQATIFGQNFLNYLYDSYKFSQSWLTTKNPGEQHHIHTHSNSLISGVFFYGNYIQNTPSLTFHKSDQKFPSINTILPKIDFNKNNTYTSDEYHLTPTPGLLILFPSYIPHSVPLNTSPIPRKSLAFNIVPTEGFGLEGHLTELKFN